MLVVLVVRKAMVVIVIEVVVVVVVVVLIVIISVVGLVIVIVMGRGGRETPLPSWGFPTPFFLYILSTPLIFGVPALLILRPRNPQK